MLAGWLALHQLIVGDQNGGLTMAKGFQAVLRQLAQQIAADSAVCFPNQHVVGFINNVRSASTSTDDHVGLFRNVGQRLDKRCWMGAMSPKDDSAPELDGFAEEWAFVHKKFGLGQHGDATTALKTLEEGMFALLD